MCAILNDTTGTLMSCAWKNLNTRIGIIVGRLNSKIPIKLSLTDSARCKSKSIKWVQSGKCNASISESNVIWQERSSEKNETSLSAVSEIPSYRGGG